MYVSSLSRHYDTSRKVCRDGVKFFNRSNLSSRTMVLEESQPLDRNKYQESSWGGKGRPARKDDNLTTIFEPTD
jgi:hypothetical protein